jgi:hypothetical protein
MPRNPSLLGFKSRRDSSRSLSRSLPGLGMTMFGTNYESAGGTVFELEFEGAPSFDLGRAGLLFSSSSREVQIKNPAPEKRQGQGTRTPSSYLRVVVREWDYLVTGHSYEKTKGRATRPIPPHILSALRGVDLMEHNQTSWSAALRY